MNTKLKLAFEEATEKVLRKHSEDGLWVGYIPPDLSKQMANAAGLVFDASMTGQEFSKNQES